jgi:predicted deacylase
MAFGAPIYMHAKMRPGSLRAEAANRDIRVLLCEAGEALRIDRVDVELVVHGVERVLHKLGMISEAPPPSTTETRVVRSVGWLRATRSGLCEMHVGLAQVVAAGDLIATVIDPDAGTLAPVLARRAGIVVGMQHSGIVYRGDALVHLAELGETAAQVGSTADRDDS